jgi:hypothetical protein
MGKLSGQHVADDLHILVAVGPESGPCPDSIFIEDAEYPKFAEPRIEIVGESERMEELEPTVVSLATFMASSDVVRRRPRSVSGGRRQDARSDKITV